MVGLTKEELSTARIRGGYCSVMELSRAKDLPRSELSFWESNCLFVLPTYLSWHETYGGMSLSSIRENADVTQCEAVMILKSLGIRVTQPKLSFFESEHTNLHKMYSEFNGQRDKKLEVVIKSGVITLRRPDMRMGLGAEFSSSFSDQSDFTRAAIALAWDERDVMKTVDTAEKANDIIPASIDLSLREARVCSRPGGFRKSEAASALDTDRSQVSVIEVHWPHMIMKYREWMLEHNESDMRTARRLAIGDTSNAEKMFGLARRYVNWFESNARSVLRKYAEWNDRAKSLEISPVKIVRFNHMGIDERESKEIAEGKIVLVRHIGDSPEPPHGWVRFASNFDSPATDLARASSKLGASIKEISDLVSSTGLEMPVVKEVLVEEDD